MSVLTDFYRGKITDHENRTLEDLWAFSDDEMEMCHDFIQWMFPTRVMSKFNPDAPLIFDEDVAEFAQDPLLKANLLKSLDRFLAFLGLTRADGKVIPTDDYPAKRGIWAAPDHNWMRVTRVLTCLRILGLRAEAQCFYDRLQEIKTEEGSHINVETARFWREAVSGEAS